MNLQKERKNLKEMVAVTEKRLDTVFQRVEDTSNKVFLTDESLGHDGRFDILKNLLSLTVIELMPKENSNYKGELDDCFLVLGYLFTMRRLLDLEELEKGTE